MLGRDLLRTVHLWQGQVLEPAGQRQLCKGSQEADALAGVWRDRGRDLLPPAAYLRYRDAAFLCQLFFGFFTGVGVAEVGVKILVQDFCGLFTEVTPFPPERRKENPSCSSRGKQVSGRASRRGSNPCFTCWCHSRQQRGCTTSAPLSSLGQPSVGAELCPDAARRGRQAATPTLLHPALQGSGLCFWPRAAHLHPRFDPAVHQPRRMLRRKTR